MHHLLGKIWLSAQALLAQLKSDKGKSSERRDLDKSINKLVGQIGGTQEQVRSGSSYKHWLISLSASVCSSNATPEPNPGLCSCFCAGV